MTHLSRITTSLALVFCTSSSFASVNIEPDCDVNLRGEIRYDQRVLEITTQQGDVVNIAPDYSVTVNGDYVSLSRYESEYVENYYDAVTKAIPMTVDIATEGLAIASTAVTEVMSQLIGVDDPLVADTQTLFYDLNDSMKTHFYDEEGAFTFHSNDVEEGGWVTSQWENEFEEKVESIVERAIGKLLVTIGTQMLMDDEPSDLLARLENFDSDFEMLIEDQAEGIEAKADQLCVILQQADDAENALREEVQLLADLNILTVNNTRQ